MSSFQDILKEEFQASVFGFSESDGSKGAMVRFGGSGVMVTLAGEGQTTQTVPYEALTASLGGYEGSQLVLEGEWNGAKVSIYVTDSDVFESFIQNAPAEMRRAAEDILQRRKSKKRLGRSLLLGGFCIAVALVVGAVLAINPLINFTVTQIPVEWEEQIGKASIQQVLAENKELKDQALTGAIQEMGSRLVKAAGNQPYKFKFHLVHSDMVNAFAMPGGEVVVFTGLMAKSGSPEEVAGVLAHEIQHVLQRHSLRRMVKSMGIVAVGYYFFGDLGGLLALTQEMGMELLLLKFNRDQETEADVMGLELLVKSKIDPRGLPRFFEKLAKDEDELQKMMTFTSTHPGSHERSEELRARIGKLPSTEYVPFSFDWNTVQEKIKALPPPPKENSLPGN